jgi:hypothetical protein
MKGKTLIINTIIEPLMEVKVRDDMIEKNLVILAEIERNLT